MIRSHPHRAVGVVLAVMLLTGLTAGLVGQHNDGPWGGLPEEVGAAAWFGFLASVLAILVLSAYLAVAHLQWRRQHRGTPRVRT